MPKKGRDYMAASSNEKTLQELRIVFTAETDDIKKQINSMKKEFENMKKDVSGIDTTWGNVGKTLKGIAFGFVGKQILSVGKNAVQMAMDVVESESLFATSLGNMANKAREWSEDVADALGLNAYALRNNVGIMYNMTTSMGLADDTAYELSTTIAGLAEDMASFYNLDSESAFYKLRAGITGETEPLKALGILVDENTTKQYAYSAGVAETGEELTQQQKVIGRYLAILGQTGNAQGDIARTIDSPANQYRRLKNELNQAAIAIGQAWLPVVQAALPYVTALARVAAEAVASLAGITGKSGEISSITSNFNSSNVENQLGGITDSAEETKKALKGAMLGIDELNILSSETDTSDVIGDTDYSFALQGYDMMSDLQAKSEEAYETVKEGLKNLKPIVAGIATAFTVIYGAKAITGLGNLVGSIKTLRSSFGNLNSTMSTAVKLAVGAGGVVAAFVSSKDAAKELYEGTFGLNDALSFIAGTGGGIAAATAAFGVPGLVVGAGVGLVGAILGAIEASDKMEREFVTAQFFDERGKSIEYLTEDIKNAWGEFDTFAQRQAGYREAINKTDQAIKDTETSIGNLVLKAQNSSEKDLPDALNKIGDGFSTLRDTVEEKIKNETNGVITLLDKIKDKADNDVAVAIDNLKTRFWALQEIIGNELAEKETKAKLLIAKAGTDGTLTKEEAAEFQELMKDISSYAGAGKSKSQTLLELAGADLGTISFGTSPEDAEKKIQAYLDALSNAEEDIKNSYADSIEMITSLQNTAQSHPEIRAAMEALGYDVDKTFTEALSAADKFYNDSIADLQKQQKEQYDLMVKSYQDTIAKHAWSNASDDFAKWFKYDETKGAYTQRYNSSGVETFYDYNGDYIQNYLKERNDYWKKKEEEETSWILSMMSDFSIDGYATGGLPQRAELFFAREDGIPEMVGRLGTSTAVANNMQIEEGISDAVYRAIVDAGGLGNNSGGDWTINIIDESGDVKSTAIITALERRNRIDGKTIIPVGR